MANGLIWTTAPPTEPGWYWAERVDELGSDEEVVYLVKHDLPGTDTRTFLKARRVYSKYEADLWEYTRWAGPIPEPKENA